MLQLLHSLTVCISDLTVCFSLGLQNLLEQRRGNAFGLVRPTARANYPATAKQSKAVLLY